jgi:hypothetical protein
LEKVSEMLQLREKGSPKCKLDAKKFENYVGKVKSAFFALHMTSAENNSYWYIDSGASNHMTPHENILIDTKKPNVNNIISASNNLPKVKSAGSATFLVLDKEEIKINYILHILAAHLLLVHKTVQNGNTVMFEKYGCTIKNEKNNVVAKCDSENGTYKIAGKCLMSINCDEISQPCFVIKYIDACLTAFQLIIV